MLTIAKVTLKAKKQNTTKNVKQKKATMRLLKAKTSKNITTSSRAVARSKKQQNANYMYKKTSWKLKRSKSELKFKIAKVQLGM